jgi:hypothetical protein
MHVELVELEFPRAVESIIGAKAGQAIADACEVESGAFGVEKPTQRVVRISEREYVLDLLLRNDPR